jgi:hypothetical protein
VTGAEVASGGLPWVTVIDQASGEIRARFLAYEPRFRGGVRVAVGDVDRDGIDEIVTASGPGRLGEVRVFRQDGTELVAYRTFPFVRNFRGGIEIAIGDVTGDGFIDLVATAARGPGDVRVFTITPDAADPVANSPVRAFMAFPRHVLGGATVATADIGIFTDGALVDAGSRDGRMEIAVGSGPGMAPLVTIYDVSAAPIVVRRLRPLVPTLRGGLALAAGRYDDDAADDIIVSAGRRGGSRVEVWSGSPTAGLLARHHAFAELSRLQAAVFAAGIDDDGDGRIDSLLVAEGPGGLDRGLRRIGSGLGVAGGVTPLRGPVRVANSRPRN